MEAHQQASFGAFVAGATWMARQLVGLQEGINNRKMALAGVMSAIPSESETFISAHLRSMGYPDSDIDAALREIRKPVTPGTKKTK